RARCPSAQCRVTDDFLCRAYDIAARMARIGNSLSVLLLAQSQMLQPGMAGAALGDTNDAALQAFGLMSRELGRLLSTLVVTRRQVWLAQAPISDDCRQSLRRLPVIPGQLFGPEAERALERRRQSSQAPEAWGGRSGAMGPPAPQPRRRDMREPRRQSRTAAPAQFAQRSRAVAGAWRQPGVERAPPRGALAGPDRSRRPPRGRSRRPRAA
ncbi:hypothetical protein ILYODFUR_007420, partial [Ilyodon furcidens]